MGTWSFDLLGNDSAMDEIGAIVDEIIVRAKASASQSLDPKRAGVFAAQLGLIAHYEPHRFSADDDDRIQELAAGIAKNEAVLASVAPKATSLLAALERGTPPRELSATPLLAAQHARSYLATLAESALDEATEMLEGETAGAHLDLLLLLGPHVDLPAKPIRHLVRRLREMLDDDDDEAPAHSYLRAAKKLAKYAAENDDEGDDDDE